MEPLGRQYIGAQQQMVKTALVTGSAGFVGRHMVAALDRGGYDVRQVDVADPIAPRDARDYFRHATTPVDLAIHLAAVVGGRRRIDGAPMDLAVDLELDAACFNWALRTRPGRLVYFSSSAAYPTSLQHANAGPLIETDLLLGDPQAPDGIYGWVKLTGEMLAVHARNMGLPVTVVRPFSGYGPDQALDYPFPSFIDRAARRADPFDVWGDGRQVRDFAHIDDVIGATLTAVRLGVDGPFNVGTGRATSFNELQQLVCEAAGYTPTVRHRLAEPVGVQHRVAEPTMLRSFYEPKVSLEEGVRAALAQAQTLQATA